MQEIELLEAEITALWQRLEELCLEQQQLFQEAELPLGHAQNGTMTWQERAVHVFTRLPQFVALREVLESCLQQKLVDLAHAQIRQRHNSGS
ncbi:hypothetical protein [Leptolyngbya sp. FACHB-261]|uniref:hypothetical protein n=1 Tax=Leptolyngbya sp. FACHB-261 TaxID=2692806 RepID=UPI001681FFA9|nr:hypothetical protein [Leptolyngbya sp. FACHB-261]MBD2099478.1 hypothetical protein [Leptolyngbya sp. FACHB-261]